MRADFESRFGTLESSQATVAAVRPKTLRLLASFRFQFRISGSPQAIAVAVSLRLQRPRASSLAPR